jgi:CheY-like chemotaxis protein
VDNVSKTILVVDDDQIIRRLIRIYLERVGYVVLDAEHGEEALQLFKQHQGEITLLLSDVLMPKMDGLQLADAVLKLHPELPVLFISGNSPNCSRGFGCLAKPFTAQALLARIAEMLEASQPGQRYSAAG